LDAHAEMRASIIIVAAGSGVRLGRNEPKAFVPMGGRAMLAWSLETVARVPEAAELVIAAPSGMESAARREATAAAIGIPVKIARGGAERQDSVRIALELTSAESEIVVVHDAARPLATAALFSRCIEAAARCGGAIAAVAVADTLKRVVGTAISETVARAGLWQAQTPQAFRRALLVQAHQSAGREQTAATDDANLVERIGGTVEVVESVEPNLKITSATDLAVVEAIIAARR
jgi:2-C-methyl-D-erythritol 4-phosphate cytidylyltransferase